MSLRRRALLALALAVGALLATAGVGDASHVPCRPSANSQTIAHSGRARLLTYNSNDYACLYSAGHPWFLSTEEHYEYRLVRFAGKYAAYVVNIEAGDNNIGRINLRNGHQSSYLPVSVIGNSETPEVHALVLDASGATGWIATNLGMNPGPTLTEVRAHDHSGTRVLDSGAGIDRHFLRVIDRRRHGHVIVTLEWRKDGVVKTARLH